MVDREMLEECLKTLGHMCDTKTIRDSTETLLKIHRNILYNEDDTRYRKIKPNNPAFRKKVWSFYPARQFMILSGWLEIHDVLVFNNDERLLDIISVLLEYRHVIPATDEWDESTKFEGESESQIKEEQLKLQAAIERQKELDEFMKDKKYREQLAKDIKAQIEADKQRRKELFKNPVVGNKLVKGAKVKTLQSLNSCDACKSSGKR